MDDRMHAIAERLCAEAGLPPPRSLTRIAGGKNNRAFRVELAESPDVALKSYFHDARDTRDRLKAEWSFLVHAWRCGVHVVPRPLAHDAAEHAGLYTFLEGETPRAEELSAANVDAASSFIHSVNRGGALGGSFVRGLPSEMGPASEACFSMFQHLATVDRRIARLEQLADDAHHREAAQLLVTQQLQPTWRRVREAVVAGALKAGIAMDAPIPDGDIIVSPSDFGFHNTLLRPDGVLQFLDFEYAGRDDPAKLAGDFYACPEVPTPQNTFDRFVDSLVRLLELSEAARERARLLRDAYRVKWTCIILNDFLPSDGARRDFAVSGDRAERCASQLRKAEVKLGEIAA